MQPRLISALLCCFGSLLSHAAAAPLVLDRSESVAEARRDPGTGICGSATKFQTQPTPLSTIDDAIAMCNRPLGDPNIAGRVSRLFSSVNFSMGAGSEADFSAPDYVDSIFPYCRDPRAMPTGGDDNNIVLRLRGYLNITNTLGGQPRSFAIKCDDGCALWLGKNRQLVTQADDDRPQLTGRRARSVVFRDPGLYPIELVYFQNASSGFFEASRALSAVFGDDVAVDDATWSQSAASFAPLSTTDVYSAIVGAQPACIECGSGASDCTTGNYCGDGICQACNLPDHCGPLCQKCPADRRICSAGKCVQCTSDMMCPAGGSCDLAMGLCGQPVCSYLTCGGFSSCSPEGYCRPTPIPCVDKADCLSDEGCYCENYWESCKQKVCVTPPKACVVSDDCPAHYYCDDSAKICRIVDRYRYEGGLPGCAIASSASRSALPMVFILALMLLPLARQRYVRRRLRDKRSAISAAIPSAT